MVDTPEISFASKSIDELSVQYQIDVNTFTGAAVLKVPLPLTEGRSGFGPSLSLQYNSSSGNSVYGVGWSLAGLPTIGVSAKNRLPLYNENDSFVFNGNEDLVPALRKQGDKWEPKIEERGEFWVHYFRSKTDRSYIRFEKWVHKVTGRVHWRSWNSDGVISIYGFRSSNESRIADPADPYRTFLWLVEAQYDRNGNAILYEYVKENGDHVDASQSFEYHRVLQTVGFSQRYLKRIRYGNTKPLRMDTVVPDENEWLFEVVFDYGDHEDNPFPSYLPTQKWPSRLDPFSTYRPGFEVRTYRLCRRVLMFHHFTELGEQPTLVTALKLEHLEDAAGSTLQRIHQMGFRRDPSTGQVTYRSLPPLNLNYSSFKMGQNFEAIPETTTENFPYGLSDSRYRWIDLYGEGLPGILTETDYAWYYKSNLGGGRFGPQQNVAEIPSQIPGSYALSDFDRDGNLNLVVLQGRQAGYCEFDRDSNQWQSFKPFSSVVHLDGAGHAQWLDLNGDGRPDIIVSKQDRFTWYPSKGKEGFEAPIEFAKPHATGVSQAQAIAEDPDLEFFFADMNGDGLLDLVHVGNGRVEYWPQIGNGQFGEGILMENAPVFDFDSEFDAGRLRFVDLDGSGTTDFLYIGRGEIRYWINASGNRFVEGGRLKDLPYIDNVSTARVLDFLGDGTPCLVWSSPLLNHSNTPIHYLQLTKGVNPRLLLSVNNSMGRECRLSYSSSSIYYLRDKNRGREWISKLPTHVTVVDKKEDIDLIGVSRLVSRYEYHDGYFDSQKREFRGFGLVDQYDTEVFKSSSPVSKEDYTAPVCIRTWFHNGAFGWENRRAQHYYNGDAEHVLLPELNFENMEELGKEAFEDGYRVLAGNVVRIEVFAVDAEGKRSEHPYQVTQNKYHLRCLQPALGNVDACFDFYKSETLTYIYEQSPDDPRIAHHLTLKVDPYGNVLQECDIAYPRRSSISTAVSAQKRYYINASSHTFININETDRYELAIPVESKEFELFGLSPGITDIFQYEHLKTELEAALASPLHYHESLDSATEGVQARLIEWERSYYWNNDQSDVLPLGLVGQHTLLHHEESACFNDAFITDVFGSRVNQNILETDCRYKKKDDYWWQLGQVKQYHSADGFYCLSEETRLDGGTTHYLYDEPYFLTLIEVKDDLGNRSQAEIDYHLIQPHVITDANDNISEVLYDPLGVIIVSTSQGRILGPGGSAQLYGNDRISAYTGQSDATFSTILADPTKFLQNAGHFFYYELDSWETLGLPPRTISLIREEFVHDGTGGGEPTSRVQITVTYSDGFGRALQSKQRVESGPAIKRDASGAVVLDINGVPEEEFSPERWLVSGHTVYNNKQQPIRQYEPFYSSSADFEADAQLETYGVTTHYYYDPIGRLIREDMPHGAFSKVETTPWEIRRYDPNDTIEESLYKTLRESLPNNHPEKQALVKTLAHADTPSITRLDPLGREIIQIENGTGGIQLVTESKLNSQGHVISITDPRGLTAFTYRRDMLGRTLYEHSIDAGETWYLQDALDQPVHKWDGRGIHQQFSFDTLGRPTSVHVDGGLGLNQVVERLVYGEDVSVTQSKLRNARGRLVKHYDQAGVLSILKYDPDGNPMQSERKLLENYKSEPDWSNPEVVPLDSTVFEIKVAYDALGRIRLQALPDGTLRKFEYLQGGGVDKVKVSTEDGILNDVAFLNGSRFNAKGQRTSATFGNGVVASFKYDAETFRMSRLTTTRPSASISGTPETLQDIRYTYDAVGNITHFIDYAQQPVPSSSHVIHGLTVSAHCEFTYDAFYQLKEATGRVHQALLQHDYRPNVSRPGALKGTYHLNLNNGQAVERYRRTYDYDLSGNIKRIRHQGVSHSWTTEVWTSASSNRSLPAMDPNGNPVTNRESRFDANGNCMYMPHLRGIDWNYRNNISRALIIDRSASGQASDAEYYVYSGDGIRIRKVTEKLVNGNVEITEKIYSDGCEIKRVRRGNQLLLERKTSHITDGTDRIALLPQWSQDRHARETDDTSRKKIHYQLSNHLGSSVLEVDENGAIISYEEYFPFGGTSFIAGENKKEIKLKDYRCSGKAHVDVTGFYYFEYRYYAPWIGNWLSPDPMGPKDSLNLYQFVLNNPINLIDPFGLDATRSEPHSTRGRFYIIPVSEIPATYRSAYSRLTLEEKRRFSQGGIVLYRDPETNIISVMTREQAERRAQEDLSRGINVYYHGLRQGIDPRLLEFIERFGEEQGTLLYESISALEEVLSSAIPPEVEFGGGTEEVTRPDTDDVGEGPEAGEDGTGGGTTGPGGNAADGDPDPSPSPSNTNSSPSHDATGKSTSSTNSGNGSGRSGAGPGTGRTGTGRGGGGDSPQTGIGAGTGRRSGIGTGIAGPGIGSQNIRGIGDSSTRPDVTHGTDFRPPASTPPVATITSSGLGESGQVSITLPPSSTGIQTAPPGLSRNGDDLNGSPDGSRFGTRGSTGRPGGQIPGTNMQGSPTGTRGVQEVNFQGSRATTLDQLVRLAGYLNLEFGNDNAQGESGGVPGGMGLLNLNLGAVGQIAYIVLTIISLISLIRGLISLGKIGIRVAVRKVTSFFRRLFPAMRDAISRIPGLMRSGWSRLISGFRRLSPGNPLRNYVQPTFTNLPSGVLGHYTVSYNFTNYPGRIGSLIGKLGIRRPVIASETMEISQGLSGNVLQRVLRHETSHMNLANRLTHFTHLQTSRIPGIRGIAAWIDEGIAYGRGASRLFSPIAAFKSLTWGERASFAFGVTIYGGGGVYAGYNIWDVLREND